jgi:hypothetical protein
MHHDTFVTCQRAGSQRATFVRLVLEGRHEQYVAFFGALAVARLEHGVLVRRPQVLGAGSHAELLERRAFLRQVWMRRCARAWVQALQRLLCVQGVLS